MIAVIFEVWPKPEHKQEYLDLAAELRPVLETIDGFISVERFESLTEKGKILSLSFFRDEAAVEAWRRAERLLPGDYDLLFNLAMVLADGRTPGDAIPYLQRFVREAPHDRYAGDIARVRATLARVERRAQ